MLRTPPEKKPTRRPTTKPSAKRKRGKKRNPPAQLAPAGERERLRPISLRGLDFDTVMRGLLAVPIKK
jgi:hypothetical protein